MNSVALYNPQQAHAAFSALWSSHIKPMLMAGHRLELVVREGKRTNEQNKRMWAMLTDISEQVTWYDHKLTPEEWKAVFSAALKKQKVVPGLDGGFVVLGTSTSKMTKAEMSELQELMTAFGVERGVTFKEQE